METCMKLDPEFFHAGPDRYFGAFYAVAPDFAGGDLKKSEEHYQKALQKAPHHLGTKVLMAENLMVKRDDEDGFKRLLNEVLAADPKAIPELEPEMIVEQQKARELLASIDEFF
jgi:predicted anti-sigma-YlaC factor YlaD